MISGQFQLSTGLDMEFINITHKIEDILSSLEAEDGLIHLFNPHTTAGLTINEGADPAVCKDLISAMKKIVPTDLPYLHGEGNSPAHVATTLTGSSLCVGFSGRRLELGTWQQVFFCEYDGPRTRTVKWKAITG